MLNQIGTIKICACWVSWRWAHNIKQLTPSLVVDEKFLIHLEILPNKGLTMREIVGRLVGYHASDHPLLFDHVYSDFHFNYFPYKFITKNMVESIYTRPWIISSNIWNCTKGNANLWALHANVEKADCRGNRHDLQLEEPTLNPKVVK